MHKVAAVGSRDTVLAFKALGLAVKPAETAQEASRAVFELAQGGCAVIFITEQIAQQIQRVLSRYAAQPYPAIIPIPSNRGSVGLGMQQLKRNVEKALGVDILFGKES